MANSVQPETVVVADAEATEKISGAAAAVAPTLASLSAASRRVGPSATMVGGTSSRSQLLSSSSARTMVSGSRPSLALSSSADVLPSQLLQTFAASGLRECPRWAFVS